MKFLLGACVPRRYLRLLREWGYSAELATAELSPDAPDLAVLALAQQQDAILLTVDLDFADIRAYPPADYQGILVMRYTATDEAQMDTSLQTVLRDLTREELRGVLVIVTPTHYRVQR